MASYAVDFSGRFRGAASVVLRPGNGLEVAALVDLCREAGVALVPQGGNTGLVGGGVPLHGEAVLSLRRLSRITDVDQVGGQLTAGAGVSVADVQTAAHAAGWDYGIDLGSRDSATVGGTIATNAGGLQVLRYGATRAQLLGVEAVFGTGATVSHLGGLTKDNTGYDLAGLLCGSEGTLGVVTAARLRLVPQTPERVVAVLGFASTSAAVETAFLLRKSLPDLHSLELFLEEGLALVCATSGLTPPFADGHRAYLLAEVASRHDPMPEVGSRVGSLDRRGGGGHGTGTSRPVVAVSRAPHRGGQHAGCPAQARRHAACNGIGFVHRRGARGRARGRAARHDVAVRPRGRR
jgi:FAD/FMN-containing dehydrogenase